MGGLGRGRCAGGWGRGLPRKPLPGKPVHGKPPRRRTRTTAKPLWRRSLECGKRRRKRRANGGREAAQAGIGGSGAAGWRRAVRVGACCRQALRSKPRTEGSPTTASPVAADPRVAAKRRRKTPGEQGARAAQAGIGDRWGGRLATGGAGWGLLPQAPTRQARTRQAPTKTNPYDGKPLRRRSRRCGKTWRKRRAPASRYFTGLPSASMTRTSPIPSFRRGSSTFARSPATTQTTLSGRISRSAAAA